MSNALTVLRELAEAERLHRLEKYEPRIVPYAYAGLLRPRTVVPPSATAAPQRWIEAREAGEQLAERAG